MKRKVDHETENANGDGYCRSVTCHFLWYISHFSEICRQAQLRRLCCLSTPPWKAETPTIYKTQDKLLSQNVTGVAALLTVSIVLRRLFYERLKYLSVGRASQNKSKAPLQSCQDPHFETFQRNQVNNHERGHAGTERTSQKLLSNSACVSTTKITSTWRQSLKV